MKICLVGSSGGHLTHLYLLQDFWKNQDRFWVTFDKDDANQLLKDEKIFHGKREENGGTEQMARGISFMCDAFAAWRCAGAGGRKEESCESKH